MGTFTELPGLTGLRMRCLPTPIWSRRDSSHSLQGQYNIARDKVKNLTLP